MKTTHLLIGLFIGAAVILPSCKQKDSGSKKVAKLNSENPDIKKIKDNVVNIIATLPSHTETTRLINETGATYLAGMTGEDLNTGELLTRAQKARAFGNTLFDLAYTDAYHQVESFTKLLKVQEELVRELGFGELLMIMKPYHQRYAANKNNRDSLDAIVVDLLKTTDRFIQKNGSPSDVSLIFSGATTKALNVLSFIILFARSNDPLVELLQNQKKFVDAAFTILEMTADDPEAGSMLEALKPVKDIFDSTEKFTIETVDKINKLTSNIAG